MGKDDAAIQSEVHFGELLVEQGLTTRERVAECMDTLRRLAAEGVTPLPRLGELLQRKGYLSASQVEATLRAESSRGARSGGEAPLPPEVVRALAEPGNAAGKYVRLTRLGAGGMGEVWKGWDRELARGVALKFLKGSDPDELARFQREAQTAARLSHPNIAAVYEVGSHAGTPFIAMQLVSGQTLATCPRDDRRRLVTLVRDAALAVHYAHGQGVIHRDLKPHNLMVEGDRVFVMDFGLAKQTSLESSMSVSGTVMGTPAYMPPEQARGRVHEVDARSDVYSLGATLFDLLADRPPFREPNAYDILKKVVEEEPPPLRRVNPRADRELEVIVGRCLEKDPARRFATARELADDLQRYLDGEPILARPPGLAYRLRKRIAKNRALWTAGAVIVLLVLGGGVLFTGSFLRRAAERRGVELCSRATDKVKEAKALWRIKLSRREQWEALFAQAEETARAAIAQHPTLGWAHQTMGEIRQAQGRWTEAVQSFDRALELDPGLPEAWYRRGLCQLELYEESATADTLAELAQDLTPAKEDRVVRAAPLMAGALESLKKYAALRGSGAEGDAEHRYALASLASAEKRHAEALESVEALLRDNQADERLWLLKSNTLVSLNRREEAVRTLDTLLSDVMPHFHPAWLKRAFLKTIGGDFAGSDADATRALELKPASTLARVFRATARSRKGDWKGALEDTNALLAVEPDNWLMLGSRAAARQFLGDREGAAADIERSLAINPKSAVAFNNRATLRLVEGNLKAAVEDTSRALEITPRFPMALANRAAARQRLGEAKAALEDASKAFELDPTMGLALSTRGVCKLLLGDAAGALQDCTKAIDLDPRSGMIWSNVAAARIGATDWKGAREAADRAIALDPGLAYGYVNRSSVRVRMGDPKGGEEDASKAIELDGSISQAWASRALARHNLRDAAAAAADCARALELDGGNGMAYNVRAVLKSSAGDWRGCVEDSTKSISIIPRESMNYVNRGFARGRLGDLAGALEDHSRALELDPRNADAWRLRGAVRRDLKDLKGSLEDCARAVELDPARAPSHRGLAQTRQLMGDRKGAIEAYTRAIELAPRHADTYTDRGHQHWALADWKSAHDDFARAIELGSRSDVDYVNRGSARSRLADPRGAVEDYTRALEINPKAALNHAYRGRARLKLSEWKGVIEDCTKAIELDPKISIAWADRGWARGSLGDGKGALEDGARAVELAPGDLSGHATRALGRLLSGDPDLALTEIAEALKRDPRYARGYLVRGRALAAKKEHAEALKDLKRAAELQPELSPELAPFIAECEKAVSK